MNHEVSGSENGANHIEFRLVTDQRKKAEQVKKQEELNIISMICLLVKDVW